MKHMAFATSFTREGKLDMTNRKPFRTRQQKKMARESARRDPKTGTWKSSAPVSFHPEVK